MRWRQGFRRVARATAVVYWAAALALLAFSVWGELRPAERSYFVKGPNGRDYEVTAYSQAVANKAAAAAAQNEPGTDSTSPYELIKVEEPRPWDYRAGWEIARPGIAWAIGVYLGFLLIFRGVRWVARGFFDPDEPSTA